MDIHTLRVSIVSRSTWDEMYIIITLESLES